MHKLMPIKFQRFKNSKILVTNEAGFNHLFHSEDQLNQLIETNVPLGQVEELKAKLFLSASEEEENGYVNLIASSLAFRYQNSLCMPSLFMIVPTLRCDHNCNYCQVSRVNEDVEGYDLPNDSIPKIEKIITQVGTPPYKIEFQGGEPLLRIDFIQEFVRFFQERNFHQENQFIVTTSLSKLTQEILNWAKDKNVYFSASLDGDKLVHDHNRKNLIGSSFEMASNGILNIQRTLGKDKISTVTTVTNASIDHPERIVDAHVQLGLTDLFIRPLSPYGFAQKNHTKHYSSEQYLEFYEKLLRHIISLPRETKIIEHFTRIHLNKIYKPKFNGYVDLKSPCGHLFGALVFDHNGLIFGSDEARMLYKTYGVDSLAVGNIQEGLNVSNNEGLVNLLASTFITETPGCDQCAYSPYCGSDPMHHLSTQSDFIGDKSISSFCKLQKGVFEIIFNLLDETLPRSVLESWIL